MDDAIRAKLAELLEMARSANGEDVEGRVRPTTDRRKLELLALIIQKIAEILAQLMLPPAGGSANL